MKIGANGFKYRKHTRDINEGLPGLALSLYIYIEREREPTPVSPRLYHEYVFYT